MFVKICANTNLEDARLAEDLGADAVGFVFAPSKRQVTVQQVAAITLHLSTEIEKVGVLTTTDAGEILDVADRSRLTMVQLHSAFDPQLIEAIGAGGGLRVVQVVNVAERQKIAELEMMLRAAMGHPGVYAVLLDACHGGVSGGTGKTFDWKRTAEVVRIVQREIGGKVIIAGGLQAENVGEVVETFASWGVDVASGVELSPGRKDPNRLRAFIEAARASSKIKE